MFSSIQHIYIMQGSSPYIFIYLYIYMYIDIYIYTGSKSINIKAITIPNFSSFQVGQNWDFQNSHRLALRSPRLCLHSLMCGATEFVATYAIKCSSWSAVNRGTSFRTPCTSLGFQDYKSVSVSNLMAARFLEGNDTSLSISFCICMQNDA